MNFPMFNFLARLKIKSEMSAVTVIMVADLVFLVFAFPYRDKFLLFEFYSLVAIVQALVLSICTRFLLIYAHRQAASDMRESLRIMEQRVTALAAELQEAKKSTSTITTRKDKQIPEPDSGAIKE